MDDIIKYAVTDQGIEELAKKFKDIQSAVTDEGYKFCKAGAKEIRSIEIKVDKKRLDLNKDARDHIKKVNDEAKRITGKLVDIRQPMTDAVKEIDNAVKLKEEKEKQRKADISHQIDNLRNIVMEAINQPPTVIQSIIDRVNSVDMATFQEFEEVANNTKTVATDQLNSMLETAKTVQEQAGITAKALLEAEEAQKTLAAQQPLPEPDASPEYNEVLAPPAMAEPATPATSNNFVCHNCGFVHDFVKP